MKIGIYGGSFDPIHTGHAIVANFVAQCGFVDEVWIMVSRRNPLKSNDTFATDAERLKMAELTAKNCKNVKVSDFEMSLPSPSYTYDTLTCLRNKYPEHQFFLIIGSDNYENFKNWRNHDKIMSEFGLIIYPRPEFHLETQPDNTVYLSGAPEFTVSSTLIREYVKDGWDINFFVPVEVARFIKEKQLYISK